MVPNHISKLHHSYFEILTNSSCFVRLQSHRAIYRPDSFVLMLRYRGNLKAIMYESIGLNRNVADKSHRVIVALVSSQDKPGADHR